jgi:hypothetical protein
MQLLKRLSASGELKVFIPALVKREFLSKQVLESAAALQSNQAMLSDLAKKFEQHDEMRLAVAAVEAKLAELRSRVAAALEATFTAWTSSLDVTLLPFDPALVDKVFDDYFAGRGPYRKPKSREDIPDAVVSSCICQLVEREKSVHVVVKDGVLKRHLQSVEGVTVTSDLSDLFAVPEVKSLIEKLDHQEKSLEQFKAFLCGSVFRDRLRAFLKNAPTLFDDVYVEEHTINGCENLGVDNWGASVNYAKADSISDIIFGDVTFIDHGHFSLDCAVTTIAEIHYAADYGDYINVLLPQGRNVEEVSMNSEGISELHESRGVVLHGHVEVLFDPELTVQQLEAHSQYLTAQEPRVRIQLEVARATILKA